MDRAVQGRIGEQLRAMYESLAEAPIPERIMALIRRLDPAAREPADER